VSTPGDAAIEWVLDSSSVRDRRYSLMMFVSDRLVDAAGADADAETLRRVVLDAAVEVTGDARARDVDGFSFCDWRKTPWVGGGPNTVMAPGVLSRAGGVLGEPEGPAGRLHFASSEQSVEFTGYVEGGLAIAERVADRILERLTAERARRAPQPEAVVHKAPVRGTDALSSIALGAAWAALTPVWLAAPAIDRAWRLVRR